MAITVNFNRTIGTVGINPSCPTCKKPGQKVNIKTVRSLISEKLAGDIREEQYFICMSPECRTSYYTKEGRIFDKADVIEPIWFKEQSPVTICYCKDVSDVDIFEHVAIKQCCTSLEDVQQHTGANTGNECLIKNPTGK